MFAYHDHAFLVYDLHNVCVCMYACMYACTHTYIHTHTHTYEHTHTHQEPISLALVSALKKPLSSACRLTVQFKVSNIDAVASSNTDSDSDTDSPAPVCCNDSEPERCHRGDGLDESMQMAPVPGHEYGRAAEDGASARCDAEAGYLRTERSRLDQGSEQAGDVQADDIGWERTREAEDKAGEHAGGGGAHVGGRNFGTAGESEGASRRDTEGVGARKSEGALAAAAGTTSDGDEGSNTGAAVPDSGAGLQAGGGTSGGVRIGDVGATSRRVSFTDGPSRGGTGEASSHRIAGDERHLKAKFRGAWRESGSSSSSSAFASSYMRRRVSISGLPGCVVPDDTRVRALFDRVFDHSNLGPAQLKRIYEIWRDFDDFVNTVAVRMTRKRKVCALSSKSVYVRACMRVSLFSELVACCAP